MICPKAANEEANNGTPQSKKKQNTPNKPFQRVKEVISTRINI
jgi:hypothetical protein